MRRVVLLASVTLIALVEACAVGPRYRRSAVGMPDSWRRPAASEDSLRSFYDSLRTARDTLLPPGTDTARVPFAYDTIVPGPRGDSTTALRWVDLIQDSVLRQLVDTSLRENRDVRTALAVIDEFRAQDRATRGARLPELTANGQAGQYGTQSTEFSRWFASGTNIWQAFAGVSIPLFKEGRPGAGEQVNVAQARASQARSRYEQTVLVALREVEDALVGLRTAQDRSAAQERQVIALRRALELADMRYRNGVSSYLDVLDAQRGLFGAELALTQAERDQLVAAVQLYRAVGAGWPAAKQ